MSTDMKDDNPNMSLEQRQKISRSMKKMHAAKRIDDETVVKPQAALWTPERRAAQGERMRKRIKAKKRARKHTRSIPLDAVSNEAKPKARKRHVKQEQPDSKELLRKTIITLLNLL